MNEARWAFSHSDEVRFSDLDVMGHLNNVIFLVFFESARVAYVRSIVPSHHPYSSMSFGFMIAETRITYRSPAFLDERIETFLRPLEVGRTSFRLECEMRVGDRLIAQASAVLVFYNRAAERPEPLPAALRERLVADGARERTAPTASLTKL